MRILGDRIALPALASAHSHAFQRGMRGRAQRPGPAGTDDFWSWRTAMYELAASLDPESIYAVSRVAFEELRRRGVLTVGEFHYVHHQPDGSPYDDRTVMSDAVIRAALDARLRIALLRVVYHRAGAGRPPEGAQRRFSDDRLDDALGDVEALRARWRAEPRVRIGVAPHSVRAVPPGWLGDIAAFAKDGELPLHMHVAEQPAEIEACLEETGRRPVELLADRGVLSSRFVAVHATHLAPHEPELLGEAGAGVCLCPTTERDLGDGLPDVSALAAAGVRMSVGVDSHVSTAPLEDLRMVELGERLRTKKRVVLRPEGRTLAEHLWAIGSTEGAHACGFEDAGGETFVARGHADLALVAEPDLLDAIVFSAQADAIMAVG
ncbi:MAG: formimidoylglutamate deiminase [Polyangiaceae bacterium]|nr:formimidoylglutamate deiminase [Polyangiaceae bacterium]